MKKIIILFISVVLFNCNGNAQKNNSQETNTFKVSKTEAEWKAQLTAEQYYVLRRNGTEAKFSSPLNKNYEKGVYVCAACDTPLFKSINKYDSGSGWPSFDKEIKGNVAYSTDNNLGYTRVEEHCANCGGHLGHVFNDGPTESGKRYCVNSVSIDFKN